MDPYDFDEYGRPLVTKDAADTEATKAAVGGMGVGVVAVIVALVLAVLGWFWFNGKTDTPRSVADDAGKAAGAVVEKAKEAEAAVVDTTKKAAAEVSQAASDAMTKGDQPTTRPNKDDSKDKLDQKK